MGLSARQSLGALGLGLLVMACATPRTELLIVADTDLSTPDQVDEIRLWVTDPGGSTMMADAPLGPGEPGLPRTLGVVPSLDRLGPYRVVASARFQGAPLVVREAQVTLRAQQTVVLRIQLDSACRGVVCGGGQTCDAGACRATIVDDSELETFSGAIEQRPPPAATDGGPVGGDDAGVCVPAEETCDEADNDCDSTVDEGFDLETDSMHCGSCDNVCNGGRSCCGGECRRDC